MDSWEWNKIAGAVLGTVLVVLAVKFAADEIYKSPLPLRPGYPVEVPKEAEAKETPPPAATEPMPDFAAALPAADLQHGQTVAGRCQQCHDLSKGGPNKIGPNLWDVIGRPRAGHEGFAYSTAMSASHEAWTFATLFVFLKSPQAEVPGTKMTFAGLRSAKDRIDLIAYLRELSDDPVPIPEK